MARDNAFAVTGTAGAGKTTALMDIIGALMQSQYEPEEILLIGLTHATKRAAIGRGIVLPEDNIRTMDSLAFQLYRMKYSKNPSLFHPNTGQHSGSKFAYSKPARELIEKFTRDTGWQLYHDQNVPVGTSPLQNGASKLWNTYGMLRQARIKREQWAEHTEHRYYLDGKLMEEFVSAYEEWSRYNDALDFTGVKELLYDEGVQLPQLIRVAFLDEAQDNNALELNLFHQWGTDLDYYYLAGDPNQAIYESMRAAVGPAFLDEVPDANEMKLPKSNRCASTILDYGFTLTHRATKYHDYGQVEPRETGGSIKHVRLSLDSPIGVAQWLAEYVADGDKTVGVLATYDGGAEYLSTVGKELGMMGMLYHNPYSQDAKWQQFHPRTLARVKAFLKRPWCIRDVIEWAALVGTSLVFPRGVLPALEGDPAKNKAPRYPHGTIVTPELADQIFVDGRATLDMSLDWIPTVQSKSSPGQGQVLTAKRIIDRWGMVEALDAEPNIIIGTVHSVKGGEMDAALIFPDISFARVAEGMGTDDDEVHRTMYVAVTRARKEVFLAEPMRNSMRNGLFYRW